MTPNTTPNIIKERKIQMSKWDKLIARICNLSKDLRFTQLQKVLETYGYRMDAPRSGSSHYTEEEIQSIYKNAADYVALSAAQFE